MDSDERARKLMGITKPLSDKVAALQNVARPSAKALDMLKGFEPSSRALEAISTMDSIYAKHRRQLEEFSRPFASIQAEMEKLSRPSALHQAEMAKLSKAFIIQQAEIEKISTHFLGTDSIARYLANFESLSGSSVAAFEQAQTLIDKTIASSFATDEILRVISTSSISGSLKAFKWHDLQSSIASAAEALESSSIRGAVGEALKDAEPDGADSSIAFGSFTQSLFQKLDSDLARQFVLMLIIAALTPIFDYYVKDALSKAAQAEDRRAMAKEIASEMRKLDLNPLFTARRRVVIKAMSVRMNPKMNSPRIGQVRMGEVVALVKDQKDWTYVTWSDGNGHELVGWVLTCYLQPLR